MKKITSLFLGALLCLAATAQAARMMQWSVVDIGALGDSGTLAAAINNKGDVTGQSRAPVPTGPIFSDWRAFLWQNGTLMNLGTPPGVRATMGFDLNDRGTVLAQDEFGKTYLWQDGTWTAAPFPGGGKRINKSGDIAGNFAIGSNVHAFLWRNDVFFDLGSLSNGASSTSGMNDKGVVVGFSDLPTAPFTVPPRHAFVWDGFMRDIGTLGGRDSFALDVNNHGVVVGTAMDATNTFRAFIWDDQVGMRPLLTTPVESSAAAINDHGAVVGRLQNSGFLLDGGDLTLLESLDAVRAAGFTRVFPVGINDRGWILAQAVKANDFRGHGIVLIPK